MTTFARWLKRRRRELGLTQEELAELAGYSVASIRKLETGSRNPSAELADLLAIHMQVPTQDREGFIKSARLGLAPWAPQPAEPVSGPEPSPASPSQPARAAAVVGVAGVLGSLPTPLTRLIGREEELTSVRTLLSDPEMRLVTLAGPPGIGKTRLGIEAASTLRRDPSAFPDGVFFVNLAPISDPQLVPEAIAQVFSLKEPADRSVLDSLAAYLREKRALLLLDNFEQVAEAAPLLAGLLAACPRLKMLVTSREVLRVRGEQVVDVPALRVPGSSTVQSIDGLLECPSVRLLVERASAASAGFRLTPENAQAVVSICAQLEGLPLAIELVAARTRLLPVEEIAARLTRKLALLVSGPRDMPQRQRTLGAAIEWSYNLLDEAERRLFARLGVFVGGCTYSAVDAVCNALGDLPGDPGIEDMGLLESLESLMDKSLLRRDAGAGEARFSMLETIREYALERLEQSGEADALRRLHAEYYLALVELAEPRLDWENRKAWLDRLDTEHDNLRAALEWAGHSDYPLFARLVASLGEFWLTHGHLTEGRRWLETVLGEKGAGIEGRFDCLPGEMRARVLLQAGKLAAGQCDYETASALFSETVDLLRGAGDDWQLAYTLHRLSALHSERGRPHEAIEQALESLRLYTQIGDKRGMADTLNMLGTLHFYSGERERGIALYEESLDLYRKLGDRSGVSNILNNLGEVARLTGDYSRAAALYEESLVPCRELGDSIGVAIGLLNLGFAALHLQQWARARECFAESLALCRALGGKRSIALGLIGLGACANAEGEPAHAARLLGAAQAILGAISTTLAAADREEYTREVESARSALSPQEWTRAWSEGEAMELDGAAAYALEYVSATRPSPSAP